MKKFIGFTLASITGGVISLFMYILINDDKSERNNDSLDKLESSQLIIPTSVNYNGALDFTSAAQKTVNAVVHVKVRSQMSNYENPLYDFLFGKPSYPTDKPPIVSAGSGVIISNDGYIVTNNHVIEGAEFLEVTLDDRRTFRAKIIGADPTTDIALIKIKGSNFPYLTWGDSDKLKVGEWVLAVGNPFNLASTVTAGIVSAKARSINVINKRTAIEAFIQTDAAVNPGNSGGALVNTKGELIGINTAIASPTGSFSGYSFAVPERIARKIVSDLIEFGSIQRAFIGISITEVTSEEAKINGVKTTKGVYVLSAAKGGAANDAGVKAGDIILEIGGVEVNRMAELQEQVGQYRPGDQINVLILRDNKVKRVLLTLRNIDGNTKVNKSLDIAEIHGAKLKNIDSNEAVRYKLKGGVKVTGVDDGKFKSAGIKEGFIITSVNRKEVNNIKDVIYIIKNSNGGIYIEGIYSNGVSAYYAFGI